MLLMPGHSLTMKETRHVLERLPEPWSLGRVLLCVFLCGSAAWRERSYHKQSIFTLKVLGQRQDRV